MFFTKLGKVIAWLALVLGVFRVALGFVVAFSAPDMAANKAAAREYLAAATTGQAINQGMMYILFAVALGILCEISARTSPQELT